LELNPGSWALEVAPPLAAVAERRASRESRRSLGLGGSGTKVMARKAKELMSVCVIRVSRERSKECR
jgi:hypothetical protein